MKSHIFFICFFTSISLPSALPSPTDTITFTQPLTANQTLVSAGEVFELGFFNPGNSKWYLGIWYKNIEVKTYVWVANRDSPLLDSSSAILKISNDGNIAISNHSVVPSISVWSTNDSTSVGNSVNRVAQLLDTGNFVLRLENDDDPENYIWQSFDYPTDTLLPGMKLGWDTKFGRDRYLRSWKTTADPTSGDYSFVLDRQGFPEIYLMNKQVLDYRSGPWNGIRFSGVPEMKGASVINFKFVNENSEVSYSFVMLNKYIYSRLIIQPSGVLQRLTWIENSQTWSVYWYAPKDQCDGYRECGHYGICDPNVSPVCKCPRGFVPKNQQAWYLRDGSDGCVRKNNLGCESDGFLALKNMKLPESSDCFVDRDMNLDECEEMCKKNCSCTAYANMDIRGGGSGCVIWVVDLWDMRQYAVSEGGQDLYVRVAAVDAGPTAIRIGIEFERLWTDGRIERKGPQSQTPNLRGGPTDRRYCGL